MEGGYNAWRLTALTPLPAWALALAAVAAAGAVLLALRGLRSEPRRARRAVLVGLRAVAALLALFLLAEPALELLQTARVRNRFAILLDASRSMNFPVERDGEPRAAAAGAFLSEHRAELERLSDRVDLEWYTFGADVAPVDPAEAARGVPGRAGRTNLLGALDAIGSGAGGSTRRLAGALVVSDGADNAALAEGAGPEARAKARALGVPVNAIAVGRSAPKDLAVERVAVDEFAFVRNTVTIDVALRARGFSDEEVRLVLRREGAVVASATVRLERGRDRYTVPLSFAPDETGTFVFTVAAPVFPGEAVAENNARSFVLRVIRDRVRVLLVAGRPSWDVRFLRGLLKQDPNVDLVSFFILRSNADDAGPQQDLSLIPFPVAEIFGEQLRTFDAVVFVDFAYAPYRGLEIERFLPALREYVRGGGALAMVGGEQSFGDGRYGETAIAEVLPVAPIDGSTMAEGELALRLTSDGKRHPVTRLAPGDAANESAWRGSPAGDGGEPHPRARAGRGRVRPARGAGRARGRQGRAARRRARGRRGAHARRRDGRLVALGLPRRRVGPGEPRLPALLEPGAALARARPRPRAAPGGARRTGGGAGGAGRDRGHRAAAGLGPCLGRTGERGARRRRRPERRARRGGRGRGRRGARGARPARAPARTRSWRGARTARPRRARWRCAAPAPRTPTRRRVRSSSLRSRRRRAGRSPRSRGAISPT